MLQNIIYMYLKWEYIYYKLSVDAESHILNYKVIIIKSWDAIHAHLRSEFKIT